MAAMFYGVDIDKETMKNQFLSKCNEHLNQRIAMCSSSEDKPFSEDKPIYRNICVWNIANAQRDETFCPLKSRLQGIIDYIKGLTEMPDILVLLEANRPSQGVPWTMMAADIEAQTGLRYHSCHTVNATPNSFGKAVFFNVNTVALKNVHHFWITEEEKSERWSGPYFGNDVIILEIFPVENQKVIIDKILKLGVVHFPMGKEDRLMASKWLRFFSGFANIWMGDYNTFPDDGGQEMIDIITEFELIHQNPKDTNEMTFQAYEHDCIEKDISFIPQLNSASTFKPKEDDPSKILVRFSSVLDHVFTDPNIDCKVIINPLCPFSDHALISAKTSFSPYYI